MERNLRRSGVRPAVKSGLRLRLSLSKPFATGEWKGATGPFRLMIPGLIVLIGACVILGYANSVTVPASV